MTFSGKYVQLPWENWNGILVSPDEIIINDNRRMEVRNLSLIWWKANVYNRFYDERKIPTF